MKRNRKHSVFFRGVILAMMFHTCFQGAGMAFEYNPHGRRDPFVPLVGVSQKGTLGGVWGVLAIDDVILQGITISSDGERSVVLNGEIMRVGDKIGRLSVESIEKNVVTIKIDDKVFEKKLYEERKF